MEIDLIVNESSNRMGLSCYSYNLRGELSKKIRVRVIETRRNIPKLLITLEKVLPFDIKAVLSKTPLFLPLRKNAIIHMTTQNFTLPLLSCKCKSIVTVHDLIQFERSKILSAGRKDSLFGRLLLKFTLMAMKKADFIIADSEYTKKRLIEMINYPAERIRVIYLGVNKKEFWPMKIKKDPFTVLYVGSEMPRKNLHVLVKAFAMVKGKLPAAKLVKIGLPQWPGSRDRLKKLVNILGISDSVVFKDYISNLPEEYCRAILFVHPSIYEGFGLPILEAMACGCPVICSDKTSLPEVAGKAAIYFDGHDVEDLADKMYKVLTDKKLQQRMRQAGFEQARKFGWEKTAKETMEVYEKLK